LELANSQRLQQVSTRLVQVSDFRQLLNEILDAAIDISHAQTGYLHLYEDDALKIAAHRGLEAPFLEFFKVVTEPNSACGAALARGNRVIVEDVADSPIYTSQAREVMLAAGAHAVQATPLVSHSGRVLGVFSTHYRRA